jgi:hypothetical protein
LLGLAWRRGWRPARQDGILWLLGVTVVLTTLVHALPENPQAKYQTLITPWASILVGVGLVRLARWQGWSWAFRSKLAVVLVCVPLLSQIAGNAGLALWRGELSPRFSEIDVADGRLPLAEIEELGAFVRQNTPPGEPVATLFTSIAVAADRPVLPGSEMAIFAISLPADSANRFHLTTPEQLQAAIEQGRPSAVIVEQTLRGTIPEIAIMSRYCLARQATTIGQYREPVEIYLRRGDGRCP